MCDYYVKWILGLKSIYGLDLDAVGCRNERGSVEFFPKLLRKALDRSGLQSVKIHAFDGNGPSKWDWCADLATDADLRNSVDIISNHTMSVVPTPQAVIALSERLGKPIWNTEEHIYSDSEHSYGDDWDCAIGAVHQFNENFIQSGVTKIVNWYLVGSVYGIEPYAQQPPAIIANSPWSGHYSIKPILWSYAHYGQFSRAGWQYMTSACRNLSEGGSVVALKSPEGDFSLIAETAGASAAQKITFDIGPGLHAKTLCVWRTNRDAQFVRLADIIPAAGAFAIQLDPNSIYSISTTTGQQKGTAGEIPPMRLSPCRTGTISTTTRTRGSSGICPTTPRTSAAFSKSATAPMERESASSRCSTPRPKAGRRNGFPIPSWATPIGRITKSAPISTCRMAGGRE